MTDAEAERPAGASSRASGPRAEAPRTITSDGLLAGAREIVIVHRGERYRLQVTRSGKLILTK